MTSFPVRPTPHPAPSRPASFAHRGGHWPRRDGAPDPDDRPDDPEVVLARPAELACAVPVLLGFHPRDSLVLVSIGGSSGNHSSGNNIGLTLRADLPSPSATPTELAVVCDTVVDNLLQDTPRGAALLVFAEGRGPRPPHRRLVEVVVSALERREVLVHTALWAESTAEGARWACYDPCGCTGTLPDPTITELAVAGVLDGQVVHSSRAEVEGLVEPPDPDRVRRREELLRTADGAADVLDRAAEEPAEVLRLVDAAIADAGEGTLVLDDDRVVALARALATPAVRDGAMARCIGRTAGAAERLWLALVRETPDPEAAEPAALLAVSALLRGDGALANVALDRAERAWPGHRLTSILRSLTSTATPPDEVRRLLHDCLSGGSGVRRAGGGSARTARRRRPSW